MTEDDFDRMFMLLSHPDVMRHIGDGPQNQDKTQETYNKFLNHQKKHGFGLGFIYEKDTNTFVSCVELIHLALDDTQPEIEVGYWLLPEFWGKGYATEIAKACVDWAFQNLSISKIVGITHPNNIRSQKVLLKIGMELIGESTYREKKVIRFEITKTR